MNIKDMIKDKKVTFEYFRENELFYKTECGFVFPVPTVDAGTAVFKAEDNAMYFMRYIRKHIALLEESRR